MVPEYDFEKVCADPEQARVIDKPAFQRVLKRLAKVGLLQERVVPRP